MSEKQEEYQSITLEALWNQINTLCARVEELAQNAHGEAADVVWASFVDPQSGAEIHVTRRTGSTDEEADRLTNAVMNKLRGAVEAGFIPCTTRDGAASMERFYRRKKGNGKPPAEEQKPAETSAPPSAPPPPADPRDPPARSPLPTTQGAPSQVTDGNVVIDIVGLEKGTTRGGVELVRVKGGGWKSHGAPCYEEVYPSLNEWTNVDTMEMGTNYPATKLNLQAVVEVKSGVPKRVLSFHKKQ